MKIFKFLSALYLLLCSGDVFAIEANVKNDKLASHRKVHQDRSSDQVIDNEIEMPIVGERQHYLPLQTTFGSTATRFSYDASITSPPSIDISPASAQSTRTYEQTAYEAAIKPEPYVKDDCITPYLSHCISETPSNENIIVSEQLLPSKEVIRESVVLSGHIETAPKTTDGIGYSDTLDSVAEPAVTIRGAPIYMPSATDM